MAGTHATLSPSAESRWSRCPGSVRRTKDLPDSPPGEYTVLGTMMHEVSEACLTKKMVAQDFLGKGFLIEGYDLVFGLDHATTVQGYVDYVTGLENPFTALFVEQRLDLSAWLGFEDDGTPMGGTADAVLFDIKAKTLHLIDLKTGITPVSATTGQLKLYSLGAIAALADPAGIIIEKIVCHIYQPQVHNPADTSEMTIEELVEYGDEIRYLADITRAPEAPLIAGEKQCKWCKAKGNCPAEAELAFENLPDVTQPEVVQVEVLTDSQLDKVLRHADFISGFVKACQLEGARRAGAGKFAGWKLVSGKRGNRAFTEPESVKSYLSKTVRLRQDQYTKAELLGPKGIEDLHKAGVLSDRQWLKVQEYITQADGKPTLVQESDKRPALRVDVSPESVFADI